MTIELYDRKFVKKAARQCQKSANLFAVRFPDVQWANVVSMYTAIQRSWGIICPRRKEGVESFQEESKSDTESGFVD